ncbi:MAG: penicillin-binding protein 2 [Ruminococcus sp.]|nr:penicillin-binding protein 2 [Ruminococcus sp.]
MNQKRNPRLALLRLVMTIFCCAILIQLARHSTTAEYKEAAQQQGRYTVTLPVTNGTIYDRNFEPLINRSAEHVAVVNPTSEAVSALLPHLTDTEAFYERLVYGTPFTCPVDTDDIPSEDVFVFDVPVRNEEYQIAQHIVGYTQDGAGVAGLEVDYDAFLRSTREQSSVTFEVDGTGGVLSGETALIRNAPQVVEGVVTTLDIGIQQICEEAASKLEKGCVLVLEARSGDILGMESVPSYQLSEMEKALSSEDSPFINRALYAYPVGSIFKLIPAAAALESGEDDLLYDCTGSIRIGTQLFRCHDQAGHGMENLETALIHSCNPYFIAMSQKLSVRELFETAAEWGFGREISLSESIVASAGTMPTIPELQLPAEKANFCFGQGRLTASPLQIARMTCAIANGGVLPEVRLVRGTSDDGKTVEHEEKNKGEQVIEPETAERLRRMMIAAAYGNSSFQGRPENTAVGAKTSTAQTGRFDEDGEEYCHGWITGFYPAHDPKYVVTVLAEDGGYGNDAAAPVFREVITNMAAGGWK